MKTPPLAILFYSLGLLLAPSGVCGEDTETVRFDVAIVIAVAARDVGRHHDMNLSHHVSVLALEIVIIRPRSRR